MGNYHEYSRDRVDQLNAELRRRSERMMLEGLSRQVEALEARITDLLAELERVQRELGNRNVRQVNDTGPH